VGEWQYLAGMDEWIGVKSNPYPGGLGDSIVYLYGNGKKIIAWIFTQAIYL